MSFMPADVYLYFFDMEDKRSTDEKITAAAEHYAGTAEIPTLRSDEIHRTERGKPCFSHHPHVGLSVSHSGAFFVCALTRGLVGVDLEQHKLLPGETFGEAEERLCRLAHRFFHEEEAGYIKDDPWSRFYRVWTAKESYVKLTGDGIDDRFSAFSVLPHADKSSLERSEDSFIGWNGSGIYFRQGLFAGNYTLCVCKQEPFRVVFAEGSF
jgi:phosphopantetheinyl transferase